MIFVKRYLSSSSLVEPVELQHLAVLDFLYALLVELFTLAVSRQVSERRQRHVVKLFRAFCALLHQNSVVVQASQRVFVYGLVSVELVELEVRSFDLLLLHVS